jgi:hypothetical protein
MVQRQREKWTWTGNPTLKFNASKTRAGVMRSALLDESLGFTTTACTPGPEQIEDEGAHTERQPSLDDAAEGSALVRFFFVFYTVCSQ